MTEVKLFYLIILLHDYFHCMINLQIIFSIKHFFGFYLRR